MPIKMIARELYILLREVEKTEKELKNAPFEKHQEIKDKLRKIKAERNRMRAILEGKKDRS
ncbi:MAG: hypothetical protein KAQ71_07105 [Desulfobulbaceae bacterium]|jgi:hypothetical protein|nr:hypothetical protein [Desulfobulbaceae bacterium]